MATIRPDTEKQADVALGARLAQFRKARGYTQVELAEELGIIQSLLSSYERGRLRLHPTMLIKIADVLQVSADELLGVVPTKKRPPSAAASRVVSRTSRSFPSAIRTSCSAPSTPSCVFRPK